MKSEDPSERLDGIMKEIHSLMRAGESDEIKELRAEAHSVIENSDLDYGDAYKIMKTHTNSLEEFNMVMSRIRKTILIRDSRKTTR